MCASFATLPRMKRTLGLILIFCFSFSGWLLAGQTVDTAKTTDSAQTPLYFTREITPADLQGRTLRESAYAQHHLCAGRQQVSVKNGWNEYFAQFSWYHPLDKMDVSKLTALDRKSADIIAQYDAAINQQDLLHEKETLVKAATGSPNDKIELRLLSERLGTWSGDAEDRTPLGDPSMLDKQLTIDQLADLSRRDLRLLRNMVYARRGREFKSDVLKEYFGQLEWYKPDAAYTDARLTALDKRNINVSRSVEDQLGGPLSDLEHKKEDGWFSNA